jgi:transketolase
MRRAFASTMLEVAMQDERLVVLVGDISHGILQPLAKAYPERYYNVGICEPTIVSMASGLSKVGLNPVVHTIAPFIIERSFEQLKLDFEYERQSVNLISVGSGFDYSKLGCTHHCYDDIALLRQLPSSQIFVPGDSHEFREQFLSHYQDPGIKYFRLSEQQNAAGPYSGVGPHLVQSGSDVTLVALGTRLDTAIEASELLQAGVSCELIYINEVKELNIDVIRASVARTGRLLTVEEHSIVGGLFDAIMQGVAGLPFRYECLGVRDFIHSYGSHDDLCRIAGVSREDIVRAIERLMLKPRGI